MRCIQYLSCCITALMIMLSSAPLHADDKTDEGPSPQVKKITLDEFEKMRSDKDNVVLDVRTEKEFAEGHVPGAVNIPWGSTEFDDKVKKLDKSKTYLVHCARGGAMRWQRKR